MITILQKLVLETPCIAMWFVHSLGCTNLTLVQAGMEANRWDSEMSMCGDTRHAAYEGFETF